MRKFWLIASAIITIAGLLFAYGRRYIGKLSFDVDLELKLQEITGEYIVAPLKIYVDNKNRKSITVKDLSLKIYDAHNTLLAETYNSINTYKIEGLMNNEFSHDFKIFLTSELISIIKELSEGKYIDIWVVSSFYIFGLIPITVREKLKV